VVGLKGEDPEEYRVLKLLLGSASPSLERVSLTFRDDAAASIVDEIATDVPAHFSMAAGRWKCCPPRVLTWIKQNSQPRRANKCRGE